MKLQISVEFLIILAVMLLALLAFLVLSQSETIGVSKSKVKNEAQNALATIGSAASDVFSQGAGAKKMVTVVIPFGYEWNESYISGNAIKMRAAGSDYVRSESFQMYGSLPQTPGRHTLWVVSEGDRVRIGTAMIATDTESVNIVMGRNDSRSYTINIYNTWNDSITVGILQEWTHSKVVLGLSENSFSLAKGMGKQITLTFSSSGDAIGFYTGSLNISATDGTENESISLPLSIEAYAGRMKEGPALMVIPGMFNATLGRNTTATRVFQVCTNGETSLAYVDFSSSPGSPGNWISGNSSLGSMGPGQCEAKSMSVHVPNDADIGNYSGFIYAAGDVSGAEDAIALDVKVTGTAYDLDGPVVTSITVFPNNRKIFVQDAVTIKATGDDTLKGNSSIRGCDVRIDNGQWYQMVASDGSFNEPVENAGYGFFDGFGIGSHTASVRCTDVKNNTGLESNKTFSVMKEFLFVTESSNASVEENAWMDWIKKDFSNEGFMWSMDNVSSPVFANGSPDMKYYTTVVAERYAPATLTRLNTFISSGGSVIMLGHAAASAPKALGLSAQTGDNNTETQISIVDSSHYITSGYSGTITIGNSSNVDGRFWKDFNGQLLAKSLSGSPPHWHVLGVVGRQYFWGPLNPNYLSPTGMNISIRTLDNAINSSAIGG